ncbi:MAG: PIN domain-containing protein [Bryobacteraceae bacterium]|jgi:predicted nucleic acid-binding protein
MIDVLNLTEIYAGIRPKEFAFTQRFLEGLEHYDLDSHLARYAGLLKNEWTRKGRTLGVVDLIIAATALAHNLVLMTDNRKDFPMGQLTLYPLP